MLRCLFATAVAVFALAPLASSCALQVEGERCDIDAGLSGADSDCDDGLTCTDPSKLQHSPASPVCCPSDGSFTTIDCTPKQSNPSTSSGSSSGEGGSGGSGATGGAGGSGATGGAGGSAGNGGAGGAGGAGGMGD